MYLDKLFHNSRKIIKKSGVSLIIVIIILTMDRAQQPQFSSVYIQQYNQGGYIGWPSRCVIAQWLLSGSLLYSVCFAQKRPRYSLNHGNISSRYSHSPNSKAVGPLTFGVDSMTHQSWKQSVQIPIITLNLHPPYSP